MAYGVTQFYLSSDRGDAHVITPAVAGTRFIDHEGGTRKGWVDLSQLVRRCCSRILRDEQKAATGTQIRKVSSSRSREPSILPFCATTPTFKASTPSAFYLQDTSANMTFSRWSAVKQQFAHSFLCVQFHCHTLLIRNYSVSQPIFHKARPGCQVA